MPSVLWRCWLGSRKGIRPVKTEWWGAGVVICLGQDAYLHMAHLMPLPLTSSCSSKSRLVLPSWFYLSGADSPKQYQTKSNRAVKRLCVYVCVCVWLVYNILPATSGLSDDYRQHAQEFGDRWTHLDRHTHRQWAAVINLQIHQKCL